MTLFINENYENTRFFLPRSQSTKVTTQTQHHNIPAGIHPSDVLCGRDKLSHSHVGNKNFRCIVEYYREQYQSSTSRDQKTQISLQVIAKVHENGGRFLKWDEATATWEEVNEQYAREKVSHALRSAKDPNRPRVKKARKVKMRATTMIEQAAFQEALQEQRRIFLRLIESYSADNEDQDRAQSEEDCSSMTSYDKSDWDFYN
mmetsp:Transcript_20188/g.35557  ORF Transcript_20188/g.35557 Transcript_20188/m.35557 type:complete len:203 (-) Transcript_20188:89-697(-)